MRLQRARYRIADDVRLKRGASEQPIAILQRNAAGKLVRYKMQGVKGVVYVCSAAAARLVQTAGATVQGRSCLVIYSRWGGWELVQQSQSRWQVRSVSARNTASSDGRCEGDEAGRRCDD